MLIQRPERDRDRIICRDEILHNGGALSNHPMESDNLRYLQREASPQRHVTRPSSHEWDVLEDSPQP